MMIFVIMFASPLYFLIRGKFGAFFFNALLYGMAVFLVVTLVFIAFAPIPWAFAFIHASWHLRREVMQDQAKMIATEMAKKVTLTASVAVPAATVAALTCSACGKGADAAHAFCPSCGAALAPSSVPTAVTAQPRSPSTDYSTPVTVIIIVAVVLFFLWSRLFH
jgi:hypothetical protein